MAKITEEQLAAMKPWQLDAIADTDISYCEATRGREFIIRMSTGADPVKAITEFAKKANIKYGKIHATFMGGFEPCDYLVWVPDKDDKENWHLERTASVDNLSMLISIGGMIGQKTGADGKEEPFCAIHFVAGGGWNVPQAFGGHLVEGTKVKGCMQCFVTELLDIERQEPVDVYNESDTFPENFYVNTKTGENYTIVEGQLKVNK